MGRRPIARRMGVLGVAVIAAGGILVGSALSASASTASITLSKTTKIKSGEVITISGSGFDAGKTVFAYECNSTAGQPTVLDTILGMNLPVGCSLPASIGLASTAGALTGGGFAVNTGVIGPPGNGTDSSGGSAATDAANYQCPPTAAQTSAGAVCNIYAVDTGGASAGPVTISFSKKVPIPPPPTTTTTTQPIACTPQPASATAGGATLTIDPGTCLTGGMTVQITGSGFHHGSIGGATECNDATPQPTMSVEGQTVPVSCSNPLSNLLSTSGTGTISASFKVAAGVVGPPASGNDSAGNPGAEDAAKFPCPADEATGAGCSIAYGDLAGDQVSVPVVFAFNVTTTTSPPTTTTTTPTSPGGGTSSTTTTVPAATKGGSGTGGSGSGGSGSGGSGSLTGTSTGTGSQALAFTGPGTGLRWMGIGGVVLLILGGMMLALADQPRFLLRKLTRQGVHSRR